LSRPTCRPWYKVDQCIQKARTENTHARYFVLDHPVSMSDKIECTNMPTKRAHAQWTLTHAVSCIFQRMQRHQGVSSQRRGRRYRRRNGAVDNTLTAITQTHQTNRTKHALDTGHRVAASNAGIMRASPRLKPHVLYTARAPAVWMGRTCKRSRGWRSVLPVRMQTRSGLMVVVCPPVIALLSTPPVAAPAGRACTSTTLTFHHCHNVTYATRIIESNKSRSRVFGKAVF